MRESTLKGIRVVEIARYVAAPMVTRILASLGAEVIKVESSDPLDQMRIDADGTREGYRWPDNAALKKSASLSLKHPEAAKILIKLLEISDVFVENLFPDAPARLGLDYDAIYKKNPGLIIVRMPGLGLMGPYRNFGAYGLSVQALAGLDDTTGFAGSPIGPNFSFPDYISGVHAALTVVTALDYRRRTGKGQTVEAPLYMAMASVLGVYPLEYSANKNSIKGMGNGDRYMFPHNAYRCLGEDRWCVIAVRSHADWTNLCKVLGNPSWAAAPEFNTVLGRKKKADEIDRHIEEWTSTRPAEEIMSLLQSEGIPAGIVAKGSDMMSDQHLKEREYFNITRNHQRYGDIPNQAIPAIKFSKTPCLFGLPPQLGEHNAYVYGELLGMTAEEIKSLSDAGVFA